MGEIRENNRSLVLFLFMGVDGCPCLCIQWLVPHAPRSSSFNDSVQHLIRV